MAKAIIQIPVDSAQFEKFFDLFKSYEKALGSQPAAWDAINKSMEGAGEALKIGAASSEEGLSRAAGEAQRIVVHVRDATSAFSDLGRAGSGAFKAIGGAADASLGKVTSGLGGVLSALGPIGVGVGAVIGVAVAAGTAAKALADAAVTRQRSAFSKGLTPGQEASFGVYAQQFLGPGALAAAASNQLSFGNAGQLAMLGIDFNKARSMSASDLAYAKLQGALSAASAQPNIPLENLPQVQAYLALGGDIGDVRNALKMGPAALAASHAEANRNAARLDLNRTAVARAAALKKGFEAAGIQAQSGAINTGFETIPNALKNVGGALQHVGSTIMQHVNPALHALEGAVKGVTHALLSPLTARAAAAASLGGIESGGAYGIVNPDSGAMGRWQFMPMTADEHLGQAWVKKYGSTSTARGRANFLGSPKAQQAAFNDFYDQLYRDASKRTKDPAKIQRMIALAWYGGEGSWNETQAQLNAPQYYGGHRYPSQNFYADQFEKGILKAQRSTRQSKPDIKIDVTNSTQSRVSVSINAAALASQR